MPLFFFHAKPLPWNASASSQLSRMDQLGERAFDQVELAEAELALLKQEHVLRDLITTDEPTAEAKARLEKLREIVARLSSKGRAGG